MYIIIPRTINDKSNKCIIVTFLGEDPETRRMRTVKNIADLRQNLEETMSSLRGTQISHRFFSILHILGPVKKKITIST